MIKRFALIVSLLLPLVVTASTFSWTDPKDSLRVINHTPIDQAEAEALLYRTFNELQVPASSNNLGPDEFTPLLLADSVLEKRNRAHSLFEQVQSGQRFLETLDALSEVDLPIGIVKSGGALDYMIIIDRINFTREGAMMEVFVSLALPQSGERIAFNGKIPLSRSGGISGTAKVMLVGDHKIDLGNSNLYIKGTNRTYVEFDCNGFKGVWSPQSLPSRGLSSPFAFRSPQSLPPRDSAASRHQFKNKTNIF